MITLKPGVRLTGISPECAVGINIVHSVHQSRGVAMTVTSVTDGRHSDGSLHHCGRAFDCRTRHLTPEEARQLRDDCIAALGPDWDVVLEGVGSVNEHLHVEYDPK